MTTQIRTVTYRYPRSTTQAPAPLTDFSLTIQPGESVLICGGSGSGKSSVIRLLNGLIPHYHEGELTGEVVHHGATEHVISKEPLHSTGRFTATVFQNPRTQFFTTNVTSELAFACENYGMDPQDIRHRIGEVAHTTGIEHLLGRNLFRLSGGEKQLVACGCSMMSRPELYLFDEPTSNLSPQAIDEFARVYAGLRDRGATLVVAEHRLHFLRGLIDRVIIMKEGVIHRDLPADRFWALTPQECVELGLRTLEPPTPPTLPTISVNGATRTADNADRHVATVGSGDADTPGLSIRGLRFAYGKHQVLDIPSLDLPAGKVIIITGPNGAGKSTFANVLSGLASSKGTIAVRGEKLSRKKRLRHSYMVMQDVHRQLFGNTVRNEVTLGPTSETSQESVDELLTAFNLMEVADRHPMALSGGQKQRVVVATAVASHKDLIIFDEPSSGLDYHHMVSIAERIRGLAAQGKIVFAITHDYELMQQCGDLLLHISPLPTV